MNADYRAEATGLDACEYPRFMARRRKLPLPENFIGHHLVFNCKASQDPHGKDRGLRVSSFSEHAAVVVGLLKAVHGEQYFLPSGSFSRDLAEYIMLAASPVIRRRIAIGGTPRADKARISYRNLFWALTRTADQLDALEPEHASFKYMEGVEPPREALRNLDDMVPNPRRRKITPAYLGGTLTYDWEGRREFQDILSATMLNLWELFDSITRSKDEIIHSKGLLNGTDWYWSEGEWLKEADRVAKHLNRLLEDAHWHMRRLWYIIFDNSDILRDHLC